MQVHYGAFYLSPLQVRQLFKSEQVAQINGHTSQFSYWLSKYPLGQRQSGLFILSPLHSIQLFREILHEKHLLSQTSQSELPKSRKPSMQLHKGGFYLFSPLHTVQLLDEKMHLEH